jgi:hypothetical protein
VARDFDSVAECYSPDELRQLILSLEAPPAFRRRYDELEDHEPRRVLRERAFHTNRAMPNRCKALSTGFDVRRCVQCSAGKSKSVNNASRSLSRQPTALSYLGAYFSAKIVVAASAAARFSESQISGLSIAPDIAVGDGALGFWKALDEAFPPTRHQSPR